MLLTVEGIRAFYQATTALDNVSIQVEEAETVVLLGPSGSGKTTLLRLIAGFLAPAAGDIRLAGERVSAAGQILVPPHNRRIGMVFQDLALWPHLRVIEHLRLPFEARRFCAAEQVAKVSRLSQMLGLQTLEGRHPSQLSGGQQQLVALARALAGEPRLVLFDEPFSSLDALQKRPLIEELKRLRDRTKTAFIYVTHDQREAFDLATRLYVLQSGRIMQSGTPTDILRGPKNGFVEDFLRAGGLLHDERR